MENNTLSTAVAAVKGITGFQRARRNPSADYAVTVDVGGEQAEEAAEKVASTLADHGFETETDLPDFGFGGVVRAYQPDN